MNKVASKLRIIGFVIATCQNWLQVLLARLGLLGHPLQQIDFRSGLKLRFNDGTTKPYYKGAIEAWGSILAPVIDDGYRLKKASPDIIIDIGANIGAFSSNAAFSFPNATVYSFEPQDDLYAVLLANLKLNNCTNARTYQKPVTKDGRDVTFSVNFENKAASSFLLQSEHAKIIPSVSLDVIDFSNKKELFLKLDCEGAEGEILQWLLEHPLQGLSKITIACEYHHWCPIPIQESIKRLQQHGYRTEKYSHYGESFLFAFKP